MVIEWLTCRCARRTAAEDVILGKGRHLAFGKGFFVADSFVVNQALGHQISVGRNGQTRMMVKPSPATPLIVSQAKVLLQVLIVTLDAPALVGGTDQFTQGSALGQRRQDVFDRLSFDCRPLNEQPFLWVRTCLASVAARMANPYRREPATQWLVGVLTPGEPAPARTVPGL